MWQVWAVAALILVSGFYFSDAFADPHTIETVNDSGLNLECAADCYTPNTLTVDVGHTITMTNADESGIHTFTSGSVYGFAASPDGKFDSGILMQGESFEYNANTVGEFSYYCMLHTWMQGVLIVQEAAAEPDPTITISTNPNSVEQGDTFVVTGKVTNTANDVTLRVESPSGNHVVAVWQVSPDNNGNFMVKFIVGPTWEEEGFYTVTAKVTNNFGLASAETSVYYSTANIPPPTQPQLLFLMDGQVVDSFGGSQVVELVIASPDIADTSEPKGEPDIAVNGNMLRMVQGVDGNWHAFFADRANALIADSTVIVPGTGFDFGIFCSQASGFVLGPTIDVTETQGFAIQDPDLVTNGVNGNPIGTPLTNLCANPNPTLTPNDIMVVLNGVTDINTNFPNQELDGQIGISKGFWPFIQLFSFNSGEQVEIIYFKGGMEIEFSIPFTGGAEPEPTCGYGTHLENGICVLDPKPIPYPTYDTTPPKILKPTDIVVDAESGNGARVSYDVLVIDETDQIVRPSCSPYSGSLFSVGTTRVSCNASDSAGNRAQSVSFLITVNPPDVAIPDWVKNIASFWCDDKIGDSSFIEGIQYLIDNNIIIVSASSGYGSTQDIPSWVKNIACWWSEGLISNEDFASGIEYLVREGIIRV